MKPLILEREGERVMNAILNLTGNLLFKAVMAGLFFGIWPLLMNESKLKGFTSAEVFTITVLVFVAPAVILRGEADSLRSWYLAVGTCAVGLVGVLAVISMLWETVPATWYFAVCSGITGAIGMSFFTDMLSKATQRRVGELFAVTLVAQIAVPAAQSIYVNNGVGVMKGIGFVCAAIAGVLLSL